MIDRNEILQAAEAAVAGTDIFIVDVTVVPDNIVTVTIDGYNDIDIDDCVAISNAITGAVSRDIEDYELEVGSAGLTAPFTVRGQWEKNIGNEVETYTTDGRKLTGILRAVADDAFTLAIERKVKPEGAKRPVMVTEEVTIPFALNRQTKYIIKF